MGDHQLSDKKQLKLFNKVYVQMQDAVKVSLKRMNCKTYKLKKPEELTQFLAEMVAHNELYVKKDQRLLKEVSALKNFFEDKPALSKTNTDVVWKFIEVMLTIVKKSKIDAVVPAQLDMNSLEGIAKALMEDQDSGFKSIVDDIASQLETTLNGKDLDQAKVVSDLMSGNLQTSGIDFESIIKNTTKTLQQKAQAGEVDMNKIKEMSDKIVGQVKK